MNKIVCTIVVAGVLGIMPGLTLVSQGMDGTSLDEINQSPIIPTITIPSTPQRQIIAMPEGGMEFAEQQDKSDFEGLYLEALAGDLIAMDIVGSFYEKGKGVEKDLTLAKMWYEKAIANGNDAPRGDLARVEGLMQLEGTRNLTDTKGKSEEPPCRIKGGPERFGYGDSLEEIAAVNEPSIPDYQDQYMVVCKSVDKNQLTVDFDEKD